jgi:hypothetical protein
MTDIVFQQQREPPSKKQLPSEACKKFNSNKNSRNGSTANLGGCSRKKLKLLLLLLPPQPQGTEEANEVEEEIDTKEVVHGAMQPLWKRQAQPPRQ